MTREKRAGMSSGIAHHIMPEIQVPKNWKQFLNHDSNKAGLARCYTEVLIEIAPQKLVNNQSLIISGGQADEVVEITCDLLNEMLELRSNQEEADTRIIIHSIVAADSGAKTIIVCSPDIDIFVLLLHHRTNIKAEEIYFLTGREAKHINLTRYIPIHILYDKLQRNQHSILLSAYCLTGCDTTSSFHGHGKKSSFRLLMKNAENFQVLATLGSGTLSDEQEKVCMEFVGSLYGKSRCQSLNKLRAEKSDKGIKAKKLPSTEYSFHQHVLRVEYQLCIWKMQMWLYKSYLEQSILVMKLLMKG